MTTVTVKAHRMSTINYALMEASAPRATTGLGLRLAKARREVGEAVTAYQKRLEPIMEELGITEPPKEPPEGDAEAWDAWQEATEEAREEEVTLDIPLLLVAHLEKAEKAVGWTTSAIVLEILLTEGILLEEKPPKSPPKEPEPEEPDDD
jgi:hypothetical protein